MEWRGVTKLYLYRLNGLAEGAAVLAVLAEGPKAFGIALTGRSRATNRAMTVWVGGGRFRDMEKAFYLSGPSWDKKRAW